MHHSESTGESRRMSHPSVFAGRRGSGAAVQSDDHQTPALMAHPAPSGSSSPGPHHHPPHSLNLQTVGTQGKKKSGFQITSVLPAQVSASGNNSIADDTESYDDMDESHTEDLSSSDILDVSVSRATDAGVPVRSSSEETLNSLHGGETPGVTSPNEPVMHQGYMVNGVHHHKAVQGRPAASASTIPALLPAPSGCPVQVGLVETGGSAAAGPDAGAAPVAVPTTVASAVPQMSTASRFRVVKLDSNSEPFRKGRWTCTEYYEKDAPVGDAAVAAHRAVENIIQSEHESTSSSSSGSTLSGGDVQQAYTGLHAHPQDLQPAVSVLMGPESQSAPVRPYAVEAQSTRAPPVSASQSSLPPVEYSPMPAAPIPPVQTAVSPRAAPVPVGIPGLPPVGVAQPVSPRPQGGAFNPEQQQQHAGGQLPSSSNMPSSAAALRAAFPPSYVTASQLEDAQRLLLQHHSLLSLPRLTAGGFTGLAGPAAPDAAAALGPDGGAGAFAVSAGADEDR